MNKIKFLKIPDLINVGVFTALYFITMFLTGALVRLLPFMVIFMPCLIGITCGIIYMLYIHKIKKAGAVFLMGLFIGSIMSFISGLWPLFITSSIVAIIADFIVSKNDKKNNFLNILSYIIFNYWSMGSILSIWISKDLLIKKLSSSGNAYYAEKVINLLSPNWMILIIIFLTFLGGLFGGLLGNKMYKKHFSHFIH